MPDPHRTAPQPLTVTPVATGSGAVDAAVVLWRALAALGVRHAVLAPGSRSAPLVYALADPGREQPLAAHVRIDERAAAFTALGLSRADRAHPAAVATTSGTATAHLLAAVMEAHHSRIPLLVLTADRPAELRGTGANQTTAQTELFAPFVRHRVDLPAPTAAEATLAELRTIANEAARAVAAATGEHPGPVHVNLGFRDPLVPTGGRIPTADGAGAPLADPGRDPAGGTTGHCAPITVTRRIPVGPVQPVEIPVDARTVVVAGDDAGDAARAFAAEHHLPLLAEPSSGARGGDGAQLVPAYPRLLAEIMTAQEQGPADPLRPHRAIVFGHPTLSRPVLGGLLAAPGVEVIVVDPHPTWNDASRTAALVVPAATAAPASAPEHTERTEHLTAWQDRGRALAADPADLPWQVRAALAVWHSATAQDTLVLGSSSLVRDLEQHAGATPARVIANRGLAGIDGTIATAGGIALARAFAHPDSSAHPDNPGRTRVLLGDLTALHDLTGLLIGPDEPRPDLDVIVMDDGGGRIFSGLEHAAAPPELLRRFFTTPHGADIAVAARALGAQPVRTTAEQLPDQLDEPAKGLRVLVVQEKTSQNPSPAQPTLLR